MDTNIFYIMNQAHMLGQNKIQNLLIFYFQIQHYLNLTAAFAEPSSSVRQLTARSLCRRYPKGKAPLPKSIHVSRHSTNLHPSVHSPLYDHGQGFDVFRNYCGASSLARHDDT